MTAEVQAKIFDHFIAPRALSQKKEAALRHQLAIGEFVIEIGGQVLVGLVFYGLPTPNDQWMGLFNPLAQSIVLCMESLHQFF
jgi:hypothetical protein